MDCRSNVRTFVEPRERRTARFGIMTLDDLNAGDRDGFVAALATIFEGSPWAAERAWRHRPFASLEALHQAMMTEVSTSSRDEQLGLLGAHPDLGTRARLTAASADEQSGAG